MLQITVEYSRSPPKIFVQRLRRFCLDGQNSPNCEVSLQWEQAAPDPQQPPRPPPAYHGGINTITSRLQYILQSTAHEGIVSILNIQYSGERTTACTVSALPVSSQRLQTFYRTPVTLTQPTTRRGTYSIDSSSSREHLSLLLSRTQSLCGGVHTAVLLASRATPCSTKLNHVIPDTCITSFGCVFRCVRASKKAPERSFFFAVLKLLAVAIFFGPATPLLFERCSLKGNAAVHKG